MPPLVLIVAGDLIVQEFLAEVIEIAGYRVALATNGLEALHTVDDRVPAVILLDAHLPLLDGRGVARELMRRGVPAPVILMEDVLLTGPPAPGVDVFLAKPFRLQQLLDAITGCIGRGSQDRHGHTQ